MGRSPQLSFDLKELTAEVPKEHRQIFQELVALTDAFCRAHLNEEYLQMCRVMALGVCAPGSPVARGKRAGWAAGVVYNVGWVNFLNDPSREPHLRSEQIAEGLGVSTATMFNRSREIREGLDLIRFDPDFTLPSYAEDNPLIWMVEIDDVIIDLRTAPREIQEAAVQAGWIPFVPVAQPTAPVPDAAEPQDVIPLPRAAQPQVDLVFQFKITLKDIRPPIWRRIQVVDCTLDKLHEHIQTAMGWTNSHLHQFIIEGRDCADPELMEELFEPGEWVDSTQTLLSEIWPRDKKKFRFLYLYDFGDGWEHDIVLEKTFPPAPGIEYPQCVAGKRACPPEDVGGPWGYADFLEEISDPTDDEDEDLEWSGDFDAEEFDAQEATLDMHEGLPDWR